MKNLLLACALFLCAATLAHAQTAARPNVIYVRADKLGYGGLGSYGSSF